MDRLTTNAVKQAKQGGKSYKITDGRGLYLLVKPEGKYWRYNFRFLGKQKTLALGVFPDVSLTDARHWVFFLCSLLFWWSDLVTQKIQVHF